MVVIDFDSASVHSTFSDTPSGVVELTQPRALVYLALRMSVRTAGSAVLSCPAFEGSQTGYVEEGIFYGFEPSGYVKCLESIDDFIAVHFGVPDGIEGMPPLSVQSGAIRVNGKHHDVVFVVQRTLRGPVFQIVMADNPDFGFFHDLAQTRTPLLLAERRDRAGDASQ